MKDSNKKIRKFNFILIFILMLLIILIYALYILKVDINTTNLEEKLSYADHTGRFDEEFNSLSLADDIPVTSGEDGNGTLWMPVVNEQEEMEATNGQIYCVEPGDIITVGESTSGNRIEADFAVTDEQLEDILRNTATEVETGHNDHASNVENYLKTSTTYFYCNNEHYIESDSFVNSETGEQVDNLYDVAFQLSWRESPEFQIGSWTRLKQLMVWDSVLCLKEGFSLEDEVRDTTSEEKRAIKTIKLYSGGIISEEAFREVFGDEAGFDFIKGYTPKGYQAVMENIEANGGTMKIDDGATYGEDIFADIDQDEKTILLGPFSIDYIDDRISVGDIAVGGISDMYLMDEQGNRINIDYIELDHDNDGMNEAYEVDNDHKYNSFFSAIMPDNLGETAGEVNINLLDYWEYSKIYPDPNQEFYVRFSYTGDEAPKSVQLHVDFAWLECKVEFCMREGVINYINQTHNDSNWHEESDTDVWYDEEGNRHTETYYWDCFRRCEKSPFIDQADAQGQVYIPSASRDFEYDHAVFKCKRNDDNDNDDDDDDDDDDDEIIETFIPLTMKLGGKVFEDAQSGKENIGNGTLGSEDRALANIKVTLYEVTNNGLELAELASLDEERPEVPQSEIDNKDDWSRRINPTITDEYGYYEFRGLNLAKKYVVMFTYDGQNYFATQYLSTDGGNSTAYTSVQDMVSAGAYSTGEDNNYWLITSKGTELTNANDSLVDTTNIDENDRSRESLTYRFEEIGSHPKSYVSTNSLNTGVLTQDGGQYYNTTFSNYDLMGYTLNSNGEYTQTRTQLIDGYLYDTNGYLSYDENGNITSTWQEGRINQEIKAFIDQNRRYPNENELRQIYSNIANGDADTLRMLQFIEDTKINAYTKNQAADAVSEMDVYPVYDRFTIHVKSGNRYPNNSYENGTYDGSVTEYEEHYYQLYGIYSKYALPNGDGYHKYHILTEVVHSEEKYNNIYPGQLQVNLGLAERQRSDVSLQKDLFRATTKINGKTEVYEYNKRRQENDPYWEIQARISDYDNYYGNTNNSDTYYNRQLYQADVDYNGQNGGSDLLEVYVTYQIMIRNQSQSTLNEIMEVVDYYDPDYTYMENLSWVRFDDGFSEEEYYDMMHYNYESDQAFATMRGVASTNSSNTSKYGSVTEYDIGNNFQKVYIQGLQGTKLTSGQTAYIYLTFKVNGEGSNISLDTSANDLKYNYAEINGYKTYYRTGNDGNGEAFTTLPNYGDITENNNPIIADPNKDKTLAGLFDYDSVAGNFNSNDLVADGSGRYEQNFEDDTDRAKGLKLTVNPGLVRHANGIVWEDERTETVGSTDNSSDALIGNGIREDEEIGVNGVTIQLVEKCTDGSEYIWQETTSGSTGVAGQYDFASFIPGDYVIRFKYGDTDATTLTSENGGSNVVSYNGQDYKSTTYQMEITENGSGTTEINQDDSTDPLNRYYGYVNTEGQNVTGTYNSEKNTASSGNTYGYNISEADSSSINYSDAKDLWTANGRNDIKGREQVINYSTTNVTNHKAEVLASPYITPSYTNNLNSSSTVDYTDDEMRALYEELKSNTFMTAETGIIAVEFEYDRINTDGSNNGNGDGANDQNGNYTLGNIDFGLVERPKAQLEIDKSVQNVNVTLINGSVLFDINEEANNAIWQDHEEYSIDEEKINEDNRNIDFDNGEIGMYEEYYGNDNRHRYSYRDEIDEIIRDRDNGLIQLTMDEELMQGATIRITYNVKVTNVGEVDYVDDATKDFYYNGNISGATISTTTANQVIDYVQNNLQFESGNSINTTDNGWNIITVSDITGQDLVNSKLETTNNARLSEFNTIIQTESFGTALVPGQATALVPGQETTRTLILSQLISPENSADDLTYGNMVEIVKTSNTVGRRMAYSVVGNQDPLFEQASEVDSSIAERIVILTPFGEVRIYYIVGFIIAALLIVGVVLIRKFVLKRKVK